MLPYNPYHNLVSMQAAISQFESELAALKSRLETQELETQKANVAPPIQSYTNHTRKHVR